MIVCGDSLQVLSGMASGSVDCVITDPIWPNVPDEMFPGCDDPFALLFQVLDTLPAGVKRIVIILRSDSDPRFLAAVPARWPFFHVAWMQYVVPGMFGRKLGGNEIAYCFGEPIRSNRGRHLVPGMCQIKAQPVKRNGHPCPRSIEHMVWLVNWWSDPGEVVLDPFAGSGTIEMACQRLGRKSISIEISPEYARMAQERCERDLPITQRPNRENPDDFRLEFSPE